MNSPPLPYSSLATPRPILAITLGDPTGIGPEIVVKALQDPQLYGICQPLVIGRKEILQRAGQVLDLKPEVQWGTPSQASLASPERIICLEAGSQAAEQATLGQLDARGGQAAFDFLTAGANLAISGEVQGLVTAPLHKAALHAAGHFWPGHTELLAHLCQVEDYAMMLYLPPPRFGDYDTNAPTSPAPFRSSLPATPTCAGEVGLGMVHVTLHMAMRDIFAHLTTEKIFEKIALAHQAFTNLRLSQRTLSKEPTIAVAALNPHAGEEGLFGDEESRVIAPAVRQAQAKGWAVQGPLAVDTLMPRAVRGEFDVVVAMYHDQGHITLKLLNMLEAVNITLGIPIIRTSVAHGTAHDQAWRGTANCGGMIQAIRTAAWLAAGRANSLTSTYHARR